MPRDSGGTYSLPAGSTATTGQTILASELNTPLGDIASALTASLPVDGSKGMSGVFKAADGSAGSPSIAFGSDITTGLFKKASGTIGISASGTEVAYVDSLGITQINGAALSNRIINGGMDTDQRNGGASQTITAGAALAYTVDRWYAYCTGANVTGKQVSGSGSIRNWYSLTGAASVTGIGFGQRIESANCYDLAGTNATLSVDMSNSLLTAVTWTAYYANSADNFGSIASPTRTQIATGTFTVTPTIARYSAPISVPSAATTGIEIVFTVGAQTSGTWIIRNVQFIQGSTNTFQFRHYGTELNLCQRYFETGYQQYLYLGGSFSSASSFAYGEIQFKTTKRVAPTITTSSWSYWDASVATGFTPSTIQADVGRFTFQGTGLSNWNGWFSSGVWAASAEL